MRHIPEVLLTNENAAEGIAVVCLPGLGPESKGARRGCFFDNSIDRGEVLDRFRLWFDVWGVPVERVRGREGAFERRFFTFEWPNAPIENAHGPQTVPKIAEHIASLKAMIAERRPRLIIFLSCYPWQAINLPQSVAALESVAGSPLEPGRRITDARLSAYLQRWSKVAMLALPQPSKNTTAEYVKTLAAGVQSALQLVESLPETAADPLEAAAASFLVVDREASIRTLAAHLHVAPDRAARLFDRLEGRAWTKNSEGRILAHGGKRRA